jgi:hypothetical protein
MLYISIRMLGHLRLTRMCSYTYTPAPSSLKPKLYLRLFTLVSGLFTPINVYGRCVFLVIPHLTAKLR